MINAHLVERRKYVGKYYYFISGIASFFALSVLYHMCSYKMEDK